MLGERNASRIVFYAIDVHEGTKGEELARVEANPADPPIWDLSPDGTRIVVADSQGLRLVSLVDGSVHELSIPDHNSFMDVAWATNGEGLFVTPRDSTDYVILFMTLEGQVNVVWRNKSQWISRLRPSPDGRHLAFAAMTFESNVWLLEDFLPETSSQPNEP